MRKAADSVKLELLLEMLPQLLLEGRRVLVFSQFTSMLDLIGPALEARAISFAHRSLTRPVGPLYISITAAGWPSPAARLMSRLRLLDFHILERREIEFGPSPLRAPCADRSR
jgi:hypothetical protein